MNFEDSVAQAYRDAGYQVFQNGWPDLLAIKNGKVTVIECKMQSDGFSSNQLAVLSVLAAHSNIEVRTAHEGGGFGNEVGHDGEMAVLVFNPEHAQAYKKRQK